jgi:glycosyltransferase involved in cell wall biosynthesis
MIQPGSPQVTDPRGNGAATVVQSPTHVARRVDAASKPVLSICIPAFNRPTLLDRTLRSIAVTEAGDAQRIELIISDDSTDERVGRIATVQLAAWAGPGRYARNVPPLGMVANFNRCIELATGSWVLVLHDDDYLLPGGVSSILSAAERASARDQVLLFGVDVVDEAGHLIRRQLPRSAGYLAPPDALERLVTRSSFVRFPGIVVRHEA